MDNKKKLLDTRNKMKKKKPNFIRKEHHKKPGLSANKWRLQRGCDNKQRLKHRGYNNPSSGYRSPAAVRGLHSSGLIPAVICNIAELDKITKENGVVVSGKVGARKRLAIIEECKKRNFTIINLDADSTVAKIQGEKKARADEQKERLSRKQESQKALQEKAKKKEKEEAKAKAEKTEEELDEEKKQHEKEEKDKLLTSKN